MNTTGGLKLDGFGKLEICVKILDNNTLGLFLNKDNYCEKLSTTFFNMGKSERLITPRSFDISMADTRGILHVNRKFHDASIASDINFYSPGNVPVLSLFISQRLHRLHTGGFAGGKESGQETDQGQQNDRYRQDGFRKQRPA